MSGWPGSHSWRKDLSKEPPMQGESEIEEQLKLAELWFDVTSGEPGPMGATIPVVREHGLNLFRGALAAIVAAEARGYERGIEDSLNLFRGALAAIVAAEARGYERGIEDAIGACSKQMQIWRDANPDVILTEYECIADILVCAIRTLKAKS